MEYLVNRDEKVKELHRIYNSNKMIPDLITELLEVHEVQRLSGIDQNSGVNLSAFGMFNYKYSILDHSLGVALILNNFITNDKQIIAALLHDLATPAFFNSTYLIDEKNFNPKEQLLTVYDAIVGSDKLFDYFMKKGISIDEMCDYSRYPLGYNYTPALSATKLEYFLHTMYLNDMCTIEKIEEIYNDLFVVPNEENMPEFCFNTPAIAKDFCLMALECGGMYRSYEAKACMKFVSDTVAAMVRREVISLKDLYTYSDKVIMEIGLSCSDKRISDRWRYLPELGKVYMQFNKLEDRHCDKFIIDSKYVNPLIRLTTGEIVRISKFNTTCKEKINTFLNSDTDLYFYTDYED